MLTYKHAKRGATERESKMSNTAWATAKKELKKNGIEINTRRKSCELGCSCVEDAWDAKVEGMPYLWQTGKRFSARYGGYLNHANLSDANKLQLMAILSNNGVKYEWDGQSHRTIYINLKSEN